MRACSHRRPAIDARRPRARSPAADPRAAGPVDSGQAIRNHWEGSLTEPEEQQGPRQRCRPPAAPLAGPAARQDRPRRAGQRRPPRPRVGRRGGRGLPRGRARRARARSLAHGSPDRGRPSPSRASSPSWTSARQFAQLIARRVRELNVYSELLPHDTPLAELERRGVRAIILSGGPNSVYDEGRPRPDGSIWSGRLPVLGICYGAQLMAIELGGDVMPATKREYGPATVQITQDDGLFAGIDREQPVWMSHGDSITRLPEGFHATAQTDSTPYAGLAAPDAEPVRHPVPPRGRPHAARQGRAAQLRDRHRGHRARLDVGQLHRDDRRRDPRARRQARHARPARTARSSARSRAAWTPRSRRRWSIARWATG